MGARIGVIQVHTRVDVESGPYNDLLGPEFYKSKNKKKYSKNPFKKPDQKLVQKLAEKKMKDLVEKNKKPADYSEALGPEWY